MNNFKVGSRVRVTREFSNLSMIPSFKRVFKVGDILEVNEIHEDAIDLVDSSDPTQYANNICPTTFGDGYPFELASF